MTEPMTDAELADLDAILGGRTERDLLRSGGTITIWSAARLRARLDAERTRADAAEAERKRWHDIETAPHEVLVLLYCPDRGPANRERIELGYASHGSRNDVSSSLSRHAWATKWKPLPDLPTPTAGETP